MMHTDPVVSQGYGVRKHPIEVAISPPIEMAISPPDDVALRVKKVELRGRGRDDMSGQRGLVICGSAGVKVALQRALPTHRGSWREEEVDGLKRYLSPLKAFRRNSVYLVTF
jgi:hypothetical protein